MRFLHLPLVDSCEYRGAFPDTGPTSEQLAEGIPEVPGTPTDWIGDPTMAAGQQEEGDPMREEGAP